MFVLTDRRVLWKRKMQKSLFYKAGNGTTNKVTIPAEFARFLELSKENNDIKIILDEENKQIIIKRN